MPLPFLKPKNIASIILARHKPDGSVHDEGVEGEEDPALVTAAEDIIRALNEKNATGLADALRSAFQILDSEPHEEGEHENEGEGQ